MFIALKSSKRESCIARLIKPLGEVYSQPQMPGEYRQMDLGWLSKPHRFASPGYDNALYRSGKTYSKTKNNRLSVVNKTFQRLTNIGNQTIYRQPVLKYSLKNRHLNNTTQPNIKKTNVFRQAPAHNQLTGVTTRFLLDIPRERSIYSKIGSRFTDLKIIDQQLSTHHGHERPLLRLFNHTTSWNFAALLRSLELHKPIDSAMRNIGKISKTSGTAKNTLIKVVTSSELQCRHQETHQNRYGFHSKEVRLSGLTKGRSRLINKDSVLAGTIEGNVTGVGGFNHNKSHTDPLGNPKNNGLNKLIKIIKTQNTTKNQNIKIDLTLPDVSNADSFIGELQSIIDTIS